MLGYANSSSPNYSINDSLNIRRAIATYVEPPLKKNNFTFSHSKNSTYVFHHLRKPGLSISFTVRSSEKCIRCDLNRGNKKDLMTPYPLSMFVHGNSCFKVTKNDGFWHYHSDNDLMAVLEEQIELLDQFGYKWLFDHLNMEFEEC